MKKVCAVLLVCFLLAGCRSGSRETIASGVWVMDTVQSVQEEGRILACGGTDAGCLENAAVLNITCTAEHGSLTITDHTNGKTCNASYDLLDRKPGSEIYTIRTGQAEGNAVVSVTTYEGGAEKRTLVLRLDDYVLTFFLTE